MSVEKSKSTSKGIEVSERKSIQKRIITIINITMLVTMTVFCIVLAIMLYSVTRDNEGTQIYDSGNGIELYYRRYDDKIQLLNNSNNNVELTITSPNGDYSVYNIQDTRGKKIDIQFIGKTGTYKIGINDKLYALEVENK